MIAKTLEMLVLILINIIIAVLYTLTFTDSQHKKKIEKEQLGTMQTGYAGICSIIIHGHELKE